jgi:lipoprotein-anchoring transpeptidase ErfK/SrfK
VSAYRRSIPFLTGGVLLAASALAASGCSTTAEADPVSAAAKTSIAAAPSTPAPSTPASPSAAAPASSAAAVVTPSAPAATPAPKTTPSHAAASAAPIADSLAAENAALKAAGVPCDATAVACVSLSKQEAWLLRDGKVVYGPVKVATGRASLPTPAGNFHVWYKVVDGWSTTYNAPMPYSVFFYEGDAFHEDPVTVRSHGCVHLSLKNAEYFYSFLQIGDKVEVRS